MSATEPACVAETLEWCNTIRAEKKQEPLERLPKGERDNGVSCPCGRATGVFVDQFTWGPDERHRKEHELPLPVRLFVQMFDNGDLPQYDESPATPDRGWYP